MPRKRRVYGRSSSSSLDEGSGATLRKSKRYKAIGITSTNQSDAEEASTKITIDKNAEITREGKAFGSILASSDQKSKRQSRSTTRRRRSALHDTTNLQTDYHNDNGDGVFLEGADGIETSRLRGESKHKLNTRDRGGRRTLQSYDDDGNAIGTVQTKWKKARRKGMVSSTTTNNDESNAKWIEETVSTSKDADEGVDAYVNTTGMRDKITPKVNNQNKTRKQQRDSVRMHYETQFQMIKDNSENRSPFHVKSGTAEGAVSGGAVSDAQRNEANDSDDNMDCSSGPEPSSDSRSSSSSSSFIKNQHPSKTLKASRSKTGKPIDEKNHDRVQQNASNPAKNYSATFTSAATRRPPNRQTQKEKKSHHNHQIKPKLRPTAPSTSSSHLNLLDSRGNPIVSKGLLERARESKADNEQLLQALMQSCGGIPRSSKRNMMDRLDSASDMTLSSGTLVGATIPLTRSGSMDSSVTLQTFDTDDNIFGEGKRLVDMGRAETRKMNIFDRSKQTSPTVKLVMAPIKSKSYKSPNADETTLKTTKKKKISQSSRRKAKLMQMVLGDDETVRTIDSVKIRVISHPKPLPGWVAKKSKSKKGYYWVHPVHGAVWDGRGLMSSTDLNVEVYDSSSGSGATPPSDSKLGVMVEGEEARKSTEIVVHRHAGPTVSKPKVVASGLDGDDKQKKDAISKQTIGTSTLNNAISTQGTPFSIYCDPTNSSESSKDDNVKAKTWAYREPMDTLQEHHSNFVQPKKKKESQTLPDQKSRADIPTNENSEHAQLSKEMNGFDVSQNHYLESAGSEPSTYDNFENDCTTFDVDEVEEVEEENSPSRPNHGENGVNSITFKNDASKEIPEDIESDSNQSNTERFEATLSILSPSSKASPLSIPDESLEQNAKPKRRIEMGDRPRLESLAERLNRLKAPICCLQRLPQIIAAKETVAAKRNKTRNVSSRELFRKASSSLKTKNKRGKVKVSMGRRRGKEFLL